MGHTLLSLRTMGVAYPGLFSPMLVYSNAGHHPPHSHGNWFFLHPGTQNLHDKAVDAVEALPKIAAPD